MASLDFKAAASFAVGAVLTLVVVVSFRSSDPPWKIDFPSGTTEHARAGASDGPPTWHRVILAASGGVVDEDSQNEYRFSGSRASIRGNIEEAKVTLRYAFDLILFDDESIPLQNATLILNYRDNGPNARVVAKLKGYDTNNGTTTSLITFDSNAHPQSTQFQHRSTNINNPTFDWDSGVAYFIEVTLTKNNAMGDPQLGSVELWFLPQ